MNGFEGTGGQGFEGGNVVPEGGNPAWGEFYQAIPAEYHQAVTPLLQKWDQGVNEKLQSVQSEYEPWNKLKSNGYGPDDVNFALNVVDVLQKDPRYVYNALAEQYGFQQGDGTNSGQGQQELPPEDNYTDPRVEQLQSQLNQVSNIILAQRQAEQQAREQAEADRQLNEELTGLKTKFGEFDEDYVVSKMLHTGMSGEQAVQSFLALRDNIAKQGPRPMFLGSGSGGVPGTSTDVRKLSDVQAKQYAVQMLMNANAQRNQ